MPTALAVRQALKPIWPILVIGLLAAIGFAALGVWQVERLAWKNQLIAAVETRSTGAPLDLETLDWANLDPVSSVYQRVQVTGRLGPDVAFVQAVTVLGGGFWAMAPLDLPDGRRILINRGFTPSAAQTEPAFGEDVTITGLLRESEPDGGFLRRNDPQNDRWFSRDIAAIGEAAELGDIPSFFIDADERAGDGVQGGLTVLAFSNNHLVYALTWFALSLFMLGAIAFVVRDRLKPRE